MDYGRKDSPRTQVNQGINLDLTDMNVLVHKFSHID
jgi:hypothetical protein